MKKQLRKLIVTGLVLSCAALPVMATQTTISEDGKVVTISTKGPDAYITAEGRTVAGLRVISEAFGLGNGDIYFESRNGVGTITLYTTHADVQFVDGSDIMKVDGKEVKMDTTARIVEGKTFVPVRFLAEALNVHVNFKDGNVILTKK